MANLGNDYPDDQPQPIDPTALRSPYHDRPM
jgi:hypothetical protein